MGTHLVEHPSDRDTDHVVGVKMNFGIDGVAKHRRTVGPPQPRHKKVVHRNGAIPKLFVAGGLAIFGQGDGGEGLCVGAQHLGSRGALAGEAEVHPAVVAEAVLEHEIDAQASGFEPFGPLFVRVVEVAEHPCLPARRPHVLIGGIGRAVALEMAVVAALFAVERVFHPPGYNVVEHRLAIMLAQLHNSRQGDGGRVVALRMRSLWHLIIPFIAPRFVCYSGRPAACGGFVGRRMAVSTQIRGFMRMPSTGSLYLFAPIRGEEPVLAGSASRAWNCGGIRRSKTAASGWANMWFINFNPISTFGPPDHPLNCTKNQSFCSRKQPFSLDTVCPRCCEGMIKVLHLIFNPPQSAHP